jgi:hypothetical protein
MKHEPLIADRGGQTHSPAMSRCGCACGCTAYVPAYTVGGLPHCGVCATPPTSSGNGQAVEW